MSSKSMRNVVSRRKSLTVVRSAGEIANGGHIVGPCSVGHRVTQRLFHVGSGAARYRRQHGDRSSAPDLRVVRAAMLDVIEQGRNLPGSIGSADLAHEIRPILRASAVADAHCPQATLRSA